MVIGKSRMTCTTHDRDVSDKKVDGQTKTQKNTGQLSPFFRLSNMNLFFSFLPQFLITDAGSFKNRGIIVVEAVTSDINSKNLL